MVKVYSRGNTFCHINNTNSEITIKFMRNPFFFENERSHDNIKYYTVVKMANNLFYI